MAKTLLGSIKKSKFEDAMNEDIDPPVCMSIRLVGHSFPPGSQPFIPMIKMSPRENVSFPCCGPNESVYQTLQITNTSDTHLSTTRSYKTLLALSNHSHK